MIQSMTAYASKQGVAEGLSWAWEMRGVNARGLDVRLRLPEGLNALESDIRGAVTQQIKRGTITLNLRLNRDEAAGDLALDEVHLDKILRALARIEDRAGEIGVTLAQPTSADVMAQRGIVVQSRKSDDNSHIIKLLQGEIDAIIADFCAMRKTEGAALHAVIKGQIDEIDRLTSAAKAAIAARSTEQKRAMADAMKRVLSEASDLDENRLLQELAVIAVKSDITEEIDRLSAHVAAANALLNDGGAVGRKLDFLTQEFMREANTLCSKSGNPDLTAIGLDLKAAIEQMREQIQNVE